MLAWWGPEGDGVLKQAGVARRPAGHAVRLPPSSATLVHNARPTPPQTQHPAAPACCWLVGTPPHPASSPSPAKPQPHPVQPASKDTAAPLMATCVASSIHSHAARRLQACRAPQTRAAGRQRLLVTAVAEFVGPSTSRQSEAILLQKWQGHQRSLASALVLQDSCWVVLLPGWCWVVLGGAAAWAGMVSFIGISMAS